jgi:hypothetical protein
MASKGSLDCSDGLFSMLSLVLPSLAWTASWSASLDVLGFLGFPRHDMALVRHIFVIFLDIHMFE